MIFEKRVKLIAIALSIALVALLSSWGGSSGAVGIQEAPACPADGSGSISGEIRPSVVYRESVYYQAHTELSSDPDVPGQVTAGSIVCINANTQLFWLDSVPNQHTELGHLGETLITVISGKLEVKLLRACVDEDTAATPCTGTSGMATTRIAGGAETSLTSGAWTALAAGDILFLKDVTVEIKTPAESGARLMTFGFHDSIDQGGGCPSACWQFP